MNTPATDLAIPQIVKALKASADYLYSVNFTSDECLRNEAQEWAKRGFTPEEVAEWVRAGYGGASDIAQVLRDAGLTSRQAECAMTEQGHLLWDPANNVYEFIRRALKYRNCCLGRP